MILLLVCRFTLTVLNTFSTLDRIFFFFFLLCFVDLPTLRVALSLHVALTDIIISVHIISEITLFYVTHTLMFIMYNYSQLSCVNIVVSMKWVNFKKVIVMKL